MRSGLTVLGIVIGVAAVIATLAIGQGARAAVQANIAALGANTLTIMPGTVSASGVRMGMMGGQSTLTVDDADAIKREAPAVAAVAPTVRTNVQVVYGSQNWATQAQGVTADFTIVRAWPVASGVFITDSDVRGGAKVAVLGANVVQQLFGTADPIGATIRVKDMPFRVVGVLSAKGGQGWGGSQDDVILIPLTTAMRKLMSRTTVNAISLSAASETQVASATEQVTDLLRQRHRIRPGADQDFFIFTQQEIASSAEETSKVMTLLLASIAAVSLLVGGIGIMNIMLVSVTERTREIGIRRAIGARRTDIMMQFLAESAFLSLAGGALGVALGIAAATAVTHFARWPTMVQPGAVALAFTFATAIGLFFGYYPALRAAGLDPVEALRYE
ncbi:MAG: ABC transporter permease [Candidatus Eisenbacteria bacterium]|nr:ABC transporter permease [Candidatus Eisenbacteria bacterium]